MASPAVRSRGGSKEGSRRSRASSNNSRASTKSGLKGGTEGGSVFNAYKAELEKEQGHDSASIQSAFAQWTCGLCESKDNDCDSEQCHRCGRPKATKYQWKYDFKQYCMVVKSGPRPVPPEKTLAQKIAEAEAAHLAALEAWRLAHPEEAAGVEPDYEGPWTIQMVVNGAKGIIAADRGGTSDPFAIIELQDSTDRKPVQSGKTKYYVKTRTIRKTLVPVWDHVITWENIARRPESLLVVVKLFDADIVTREPLGEVTLPVVKFPSEKGVVESKWYDLELSGKMKRVGKQKDKTRDALLFLSKWTLLPLPFLHAFAPWLFGLRLGEGVRSNRDEPRGRAASLQDRRPRKNPRRIGGRQRTPRR